MPSPSESLDIAQLAIFSPLLLLTLLVIYRHGVHRQSGWIYLSIFCLIRIIGGALGVTAETVPTGKGKVGDLEWSAILGSIGISPLLLASIGLLKRITDETSERTAAVDSVGGGKQSRFETVMSFSIVGRIFGRLGVHEFATSYRSRFLQLLQLPAIVALILGIVGGSDRASRLVSSQNTGEKLIKVALIIFLVVYVCIFPLVAKSTVDIQRLPPGEKRVLFALIVALPLLGVRILFGILAYFSTVSTFSPTTGNVFVRAFMATLEETLIVIGYILAGILVPAYCDTRKDDTQAKLQYGEMKRTGPVPRPLRASR